MIEADLCFDTLNIEDQSPNVEEITINHLNDDCLINIFEYLTIDEKLQLEFISKRWNAVAKRSWSCEKKFMQRSLVKKNKNTSYLLNILDRCSNYLNEVSLSSDPEDSIDYSRIFKKLSANSYNIKHLKISDYWKRFSEEDLELLFSKINLCSATFSGLHIDGRCLQKLNPDAINKIKVYGLYVNNKDYLRNFFSKFKNLKEAFIASDNIDTLNAIIDGLDRSKCESIRDCSILRINSVQNVYIVKLPALLAKQKSISSLSLHRCINKEIIDALPAEHLESLELNFDYSNWDSNRVLFRLDRFKSLKRLNCICDTVGKYDFHNICSAIYVREINIELYSHCSVNEKLTNCFSSLKNLETLSISHDSDYESSADDLIKDILLCKSLKQLDLNGFYFTNQGELNNININFNLISLSFESSFLKDSHVASFINIVPNLEELDILYCPKLTKNLMKKISDIKINRGDKHILKVKTDLEDIKEHKNNLENNNWPLVSIDQ